jgi:Poxvirus Late Transcription Factor VLTF3 like
MYDYLHNYIMQLITTVYTKHADCSPMNNFTHYYVAHFYTMIRQNRFDDEYIRKLSTYDVLSRLTTLAEDCGCADTLSHNELCNFMNEYSRKLKCKNCKSVILEHDMECPTCGCSIKILYSNVIPRVGYNAYYAFGNKKHNPIKHCELWLSLLQGQEHVAMSHEDLISLVTLAESGYSACNGEFTCNVIRSYLKKLRLTKYNPHISWIRKYIENHLNITRDERYYNFTQNEINEILSVFNQILAQYYTLRSDSNVLMQLNRKSIHNLYYPYYLVKILQIVIIDEERLAFMLSNIHIQSQKTTLKNDMLWTLMRPKLSFSRPTSSTPMLPGVH